MLTSATNIVTAVERRLRCPPLAEQRVLIGVVACRDLLPTLIRDDDVIGANGRALLDDDAVAAGTGRSKWTRNRRRAGPRRAGVTGVELRQVAAFSLVWDA